MKLFDPYLVLENLTIGVFILRLENKETKEFRIIFSNKTNSKIVGIDMQKFSGKTLRESFPQTYEQGIADKYFEAVISQKTVELGTLDYEDGQIDKTTFYLKAIPLNEDTVMVHIENITDLKKSKVNLEAQQKILINKNEELNQYTYIVSHDLQEPLRTIQSFINLFEQKYKGKLDKNADTYLHYIVEASKSMSRLIKDLLDYSRIGNKEKDIEKISINALLKDIQKDLYSLVNESNTIIDINEMPNLKGHRTELKMLFQNLITNAIKFTLPENRPHIKINCKTEKNNYLFSVTDNGIGIEKDGLNKIFNIFQRLHSKKEYEGSGIGLAHCKKIVQMHDGDIWAEPNENTRGTTFYFTILKQIR